MLHNLINERSAEELEAAGKQSTAIKAAGLHNLTIKSVFNTEGTSAAGATWTSITVNLENESGETVRINEFYGVAKSADQADIDKANKANTRILGIMTRLAKSAGFPAKTTLAAATGGMTTATDDKGRTITTYPKFAGKKVQAPTYTEISADQKDATKVYAKQIIDTAKFLDKDGKDAMGRDCAESYDAEAKSKIEIYFKDRDNIACIQKMAQLKEQSMGIATNSQPAAANQPLAGMPEADAGFPADDI